MNDRKLRSKLIRLAHQKPELRLHLLPLLQRAASVSLAGLTEAELDAISSIYLYMARKGTPQYKDYGGIDTKSWKLTPGTVKRLINLGFAESSDLSVNSWQKMPAGIRLTEKGILAGKQPALDPDSRYEKVLGQAISFERKSYGAGKVYTWAYLKSGGAWVSLGDPYPARNWPTKELEDAVRQKMTELSLNPNP